MRALVFGFDYHTDSLRATIDVLRRSGATHLSWLLHENKIPTYGGLLRSAGVTLWSTAPGHIHRITDGTPSLGERAEGDLRFLMDREAAYDHEWARTLHLELLRQHVMSILNTETPDILIFSDIPHGAASYLLYRIGKFLSIPTLVFRYGPTPFHVNLVSDIDERLLDSVTPHQRAGTDLSESSRNYLDGLRGQYSEARPAYSRDSQSLTGVIAKRLRSRALKPDASLVHQSARRELLRRWYERHAVQDLDETGSPTISAFLSVQPERTTTPDGAQFAQQWLMVSRLRHLAPPDWTILVREHPATFVRGARLVRSPAFYEALTDLSNVRLVSTQISPFDLIAKSAYVATVSGTIAFETAVRDRLSVVFGNAPYRGCRGVIDATGDVSTLDLRRPEDFRQRGSPPEEFLARFDRSTRTYVAPWSPAIDVRAVRRSGEAFVSLLPDALESLPSA